MIKGKASASHSRQPTVGVISLLLNHMGVQKGHSLNECSYSIHKFWVLLLIVYAFFKLQSHLVAERGAWGAQTCTDCTLENSIVSLLFAPNSCVVHIDCVSPLSNYTISCEEGTNSNLRSSYLLSQLC